MGIVLSPQAIEAWKAAGCELHEISSRIIAIRLLMKDIHDKDIGLYLVSAYAPIATADELQWENFFNDLDACYAKKCHGDIFVIGSDTNSSMGCRLQPPNNGRCSVGCYGLSHVNDSGRRFSSYLAINNLLAITTCYHKKRYGTLIHPRSKLHNSNIRLTTSSLTRELHSSSWMLESPRL